MAYIDFTLEQVITNFELTEVRQHLFEQIRPIEPSDWLTESLSRGIELALSSASEKARSEFIVAPILMEMDKRTVEEFAIYSGRNLDADSGQGLNGECDFILSKGDLSYTLRTPILALVEAKKNDIESALGQCAAQMLGAKLFNENHQNRLDAIFGCVTTGETWQFLKLVDKQLIIDEDRYYINQLNLVLGALQKLLDHYKD